MAELCVKARGGFCWAMLLAGAWWVPVPARACTVPVYQYALEDWPADPYEIVVFHQGPMGLPQRAVVESLEQAVSDEFARLNATVRLVDVDAEKSDAVRAMWEGQRTTTLPWMIVRQPVRWTPEVITWSGPLDEPSARLVMDSPVRREIARRIGQGEAAVWVLLESGNKSADDETFKFLQDQLGKWTDALKRMLPEDVPAARPTTDAAEEETAIRPPRFSVVRVSRTDPAEKLLVNTLINSEDDLKAFSEPMAFPVFGRGRVLYALVGRGITERNIGEACAYVSDACSCWVKAQNPGCDLLMRADWEGMASGQRAGTPEWTTPPDATAPDSEIAASVADAGEGRSSRLVRNSILGLAGGLIVVALAAWVLRSRDRASRGA